MYTYIPPPFFISFPFKSPQSTQQSSLCYTAGSHQLSISYILVYICQSQSLNSSHTLFPPLVSIHLFSTSVSVFLPCKQVHLYHFSRFHVYMLIYNIFVFLFLTTSLFMTVSRSIHVSTNDPILFLFMANIPLYICTTSSLSIHLLMGIQVASKSWLL